jgi:hypothetical protein
LQERNSNEEVRENITNSWPWGEKNQARVNISKRLSACSLALLIDTANASLISIRLLDGLKGMIGSDGHN